MQPEYLVVAHLDLALELFHDLLILNNSPLHLDHDLIQLFAALVRSPHFLSPLILVGQQVVLNLEAHSGGVGVLSAVGFEGALLYGRGKFNGLRLFKEVIV